MSSAFLWALVAVDATCPTIYADTDLVAEDGYSGDISLYVSHSFGPPTNCEISSWDIACDKCPSCTLGSENDTFGLGSEDWPGGPYSSNTPAACQAYCSYIGAPWFNWYGNCYCKHNVQMVAGSGVSAGQTCAMPAGGPTKWNSYAKTDASDGPISVLMVDVDGDNMADLVECPYADNCKVWYSPSLGS